MKLLEYKRYLRAIDTISKFSYSPGNTSSFRIKKIMDETDTYISIMSVEKDKERIIVSEEVAFLGIPGSIDSMAGNFSYKFLSNIAGLLIESKLRNKDFLPVRNILTGSEGIINSMVWTSGITKKKAFSWAQVRVWIGGTDLGDLGGKFYMSYIDAFNFLVYFDIL